jgi:uncharacterized membrane protein YedE/YeeE
MENLFDLPQLLETLGDHWVLAAGGAAIGLVFGFSAQRSKFCARAAVIEGCEGEWSDRFAVWMLAFAVAILATQALVLSELLKPQGSRHLGSPGSISGAVIGGLMFGIGMIMTRGCASRLLILSANGNLRALLSGLVFAVTVQATISGLLAPLRQWINALWMVEGGVQRNLLSGMPDGFGLLIGVLLVTVALWGFKRSAQYKTAWPVGGVVVGLAIAIGWGFTQLVAGASFEPIAIQSLSFSSPSAEWLMRALSTETAPKFGFDAGLLPGVFAGSLLASMWFGEFKFEGFQTENKLGHYLTGAVLMGFGAVSAGGCTVGAGMTGGVIFSNTAWLTLASIILGAALSYKLLKSIDSPT